MTKATRSRLWRGVTHVALALAVTAPGAAVAQTIGTSKQRLILYPDNRLWTENGNHIPMCWHESLQFPNNAAAARARQFVRQTVEEGWIQLVNLRISWVDCPTAGDALHVRVKLRIGDANENGTTKQHGMATLSNAEQRRVQVPNDAPGLLMGFRSTWDDSDAGRASFRSLILHEFGHILGFAHEHQRPDANSTNGACYQNGLTGGIKIGPIDPLSIMGWSYCNLVTGLSPNDIAGVRQVYGRGDIVTPQAVTILQLHNSGAIWRYTGTPCNAAACPGWERLDINTATVAIGEQYQKHADGKIWRWDGRLRCTGNDCPGWILIDQNPRTAEIVSSYGALYQRHVDGKIWRYDGTSRCVGAACPGWQLIDSNPATKQIVAAYGALYQMHADGKLWRWDGRSSCSATACPGWMLIDMNPRTASIAAAHGAFYQRHVDGKIWAWDGRTACTANACPGWTLIDNNPATTSIVAMNGALFQKHADGKIWVWDRVSRCSATACPGWTLIDNNSRTADISAGAGVLLQRHVDGAIWKWDGRSRCLSATVCPGWELLDRNPSTKVVVAIDTRFIRQ